MRMFGRREPALPAEVAGALGLGRGDRALAWARDETTGAYVVASLHALHHVPATAVDGGGAAGADRADRADGGGGAAGAGSAAFGTAPAAVGAAGAARWARPWHEVAAGAWEPKTRALTVTWADGGRPVMWALAGDRVSLPSVLHERVRASVLVSIPVRMGESDLGRAALRKDLATDALVEQVTLRRGSARQDPEVAAYVETLLRDLREQAGL